MWSQLNMYAGEVSFSACSLYLSFETCYKVDYSNF